MHRTEPGCAGPTAHGHGHNHAHAERITYTLTGTLTGTLTDGAGDTVTFTDAAFRWQVIGDTTTGTSVLGLAPVPVFEVPPHKDMIKIGDQVLSPTIPTVFATATVPERVLERHHQQGIGVAIPGAGRLRRHLRGQSPAGHVRQRRIAADQRRRPHNHRCLLTALQRPHLLRAVTGRRTGSLRRRMLQPKPPLNRLS